MLNKVSSSDFSWEHHFNSNTETCCFGNTPFLKVCLNVARGRGEDKERVSSEQ